MCKCFANILPGHIRHVWDGWRDGQEEEEEDEEEGETGGHEERNGYSK